MQAEPSSVQAYDKHVKSGKARSQREAILRHFKRQYPASFNNREIMEITGFPINVVTARVNSLFKSPKSDLDRTMPLALSGHRTDPTTGSTGVRYLIFNLAYEKPVQKSLFGGNE